uniref:Rhodanese domain-containing protein n=1 Tax=Plectus sambesii TaxID=2011161 RepID=A0A914WWK7_9BILA
MMADHHHESKKSVAATSSSRQEIFRRIKADQFVTMILQSAQAQHEEALVLRALEGNKIVDSPANAENGETANTIHNVIIGIGEKTDSPLTRNVQVDAARPYLLLDVRLPEEYNLGHIITAVNYPHTMLSRERYDTLEMKAYKNKPGKMIVLYDDNERNAPRVTTTILQRGYTNCVLLSGGVIAAHKKYPQGLITGRIWDPLNPPKTPAAAQPAPKVDEFTEEDLNALRSQLQHNLIPRASKSRLMTATKSATSRNKSTEQQRRGTTASTAAWPAVWR